MKKVFLVTAAILVLSQVPPSGLFGQPVNGIQQAETLDLVALVNDGAELLRLNGEGAFKEFRILGSRWRNGDTYVFVLDVQGNMLVHPEAELEGKNQLALKDINGKPIIHGLLEATATSAVEKSGWYHYQWPVPGALMPRWKSTYVKRTVAPSGKSYIIGCGMYNDRMERAFVVDMVKGAVEQIEKEGSDAFRLLHDITGPYRVKDAYIFVVDDKGVELVNPGFPNLEGRNLMDLKDSQGKFLMREMFQTLRVSGSGWVDYMWPKPGESVSTQKSAYVTRARMGSSWVLVGCGVYLADAPKEVASATKMSASELMSLVADAAEVFEREGEQAFPEFKKKGSRWFRDETYFFVWTLDGTRIFHAADPAGEGIDVSDLQDVLKRPIGKMFIEAATSAAAEGWVHYMYPEPGDIFPTWKSSFVKRVTFPSGKQYIVGCGIYNMRMDKAFIVDVVNRAANLVAAAGADAFAELRDKKGPFVFMDTYVFVDNIDGVELVNAAEPWLEGRQLMDLRDAHGNLAAKEYIDAAVRNGSAWVDYNWYTPGDNRLSRKYTYVRKVQVGASTYIVGSGLYADDEPGGLQKTNGSRGRLK